VEPNSPKPKPKKNSNEWFPGPIFLWIFLFLSVFYFVRLGQAPLEKGARQLTYGEFYGMLEANPRNATLKSAVRVVNEIAGDLTNGEKYHVIVPETGSGSRTSFKAEP